jgi:hypothetical protein
MDSMELVLDRLQKIERSLAMLLDKQAVKDWYTTEEVARILDRDPFTVREWCRLGRVCSQKKNTGRGRYQAWVIAHEELLRIQREGLLPLR